MTQRLNTRGKVFVSTELGGGSATARTSAIARKGVRNILIHAGILQADLEYTPSKILDMSDEHSYLFSVNDGLVDYNKDLEDPIEVGDVAARICSLDCTGEAPVEYVAKNLEYWRGVIFQG